LSFVSDEDCSIYSNRDRYHPLVEDLMHWDHTTIVEATVVDFPSLKTTKQKTARRVFASREMGFIPDRVTVRRCPCLTPKLKQTEFPTMRCFVGSNRR